MTGRSELRALTGMRGIAAWFVVLYHIRLSIAGLSPFWLAILARGYLAVDFFFLLSGFVLWLSWSERLRGGGLTILPEFLWRRLARIWPLHLFMLGCAVVLALVLAMVGKHNATDYPFVDLPLHALLLHNWGFTDHLAWNDPSWSISTEWAAYLAFPLLALAIDWRRMPTVAIVAAIITLLALLHLVMAGAASLGSEIWTFGLRRCLIEFTIGTAICALWLRYRDRPMIAVCLSAGVASVLTGALVADVPETLVMPGALGAALLCLALTSDWRGNPLAAPPLHALGELSYATYLGHSLLFVVFKLALVSDARAIGPAFVALYLTLVLVSSVMLYTLIERPAQARINRLANRWRAGPGPQASAVSSASAS